MRIALHWRILIGLLAGIAVGLAIHTFWTAETWASMGVGDPAAFLDDKASESNAGATTGAMVAKHVALFSKFVGDLFIRTLTVVAVPIVLCALLMAAAGLGDVRAVGRIGGRTLALFAVMALAATTLGLFLGNTFRPGAGLPDALRVRLIESQGAKVEALVAAKAEVGGFWTTLLNMFPRNVFDSLARGQMMHVIIIAIVLGVAFMYLPRERRDPAMAFFELIEKAVGLVVQAMMAFSPFAVFFLIAPVTAKLGVDILEALGKYCLVVTLGLSILLFIEYPLLVKVLGRYPLGRFFKGVVPAQLTALSTSSSAATLPVTMNCVEKRLGVSKGVTSFVCSVGSTLNMDGTAMYQAMAATFIAQIYGIELTLTQQFTLLITATLASIGAPGIPSGGMVLLVAVLESVGIPPQGMALILGVDPLLDRLRTVINVTGDAVASVVVERHEPIEAGTRLDCVPTSGEAA